jgi:hypothetical protein
VNNRTLNLRRLPSILKLVNELRQLFGNEQLILKQLLLLCIVCLLALLSLVNISPGWIKYLLRMHFHLRCPNQKVFYFIFRIPIRLLRDVLQVPLSPPVFMAYRIFQPLYPLVDLGWSRARDNVLVHSVLIMIVCVAKMGRTFWRLNRILHNQVRKDAHVFVNLL